MIWAARGCLGLAFVNPELTLLSSALPSCTFTWNCYPRIDPVRCISRGPKYLPEKKGRGRGGAYMYGKEAYTSTKGKGDSSFVTCISSWFHELLVKEESGRRMARSETLHQIIVRLLVWGIQHPIVKERQRLETAACACACANKSAAFFSTHKSLKAWRLG